MKCTTTINASDTPRGISYSGGLVPKSWTMNFDDETGRATREVIFEAETFEGLAVKGDVPGSTTDFHFPPTPSLTLPPPPPIVMPGGVTPGTDGGPPKVAITLDGVGIAYTENFNTSDAGGPSWALINAGLSGWEVGANRLFVTPNGAIYCGHTVTIQSFLARADFPGRTWTILEQPSKYGGGNLKLNFVGFNPLAAEDVCYQVDSNSTKYFYHGSGSTWTSVPALVIPDDPDDMVSFGNGKWMTISPPSSTNNVYTWLPNYTGLTVAATGLPYRNHIRISTTSNFLLGTYNAAYTLQLGQNFGTTLTAKAAISPDLSLVPFSNKIACDPTGVEIMAAGGTGSSITPTKSNDGGATFLLVTGLPVTNWRFAYAGNGTDGSRWIAGADGGYLYYNDASGVGSWTNKLGNLPALAPGGVHIVGICVVAQ